MGIHALHFDGDVAIGASDGARVKLCGLLVVAWDIGSGHEVAAV